MTYQEFVNKYNGKYVDFDGAYGGQCWDLAEQYFTEVLGLPASILAGCGLVSNMLYPPKREELDRYFYEVSTTEMVQGDVCIWEYGHIALFDHWDGSQNWYFSQNPNPCQIMTLGGNGMHAFRLRKEEPKINYVGDPVDRNENIDQVEVHINELRCRKSPNGDILGIINTGIYNLYDKVDKDGFTWLKIGNDMWIAYGSDWETLYPKKESPKEDPKEEPKEKPKEEPKENLLSRFITLFMKLISILFKK